MNQKLRRLAQQNIGTNHIAICFTLALLVYWKMMFDLAFGVNAKKDEKNPNLMDKKDGYNFHVNKRQYT